MSVIEEVHWVRPNDTRYRESRESDASDDVLEPRIVSERVETRIVFDPHHPGGALVDPLFKPFDHVVGTAQASLHDGDLDGGTYWPCERSHEPAQLLLGVGPPSSARERVRQSRDVERTAAGELLGSLQLRESLRRPALLLIGLSQHQVRRCKVGVEFQRRAILLDRGVVLTREVVAPAKPRVDDRRQRIQPASTLRLSDRLLVTPDRGEVIRVPMMGVRIIGIDRDGALKASLCLRPVPIVIEAHERQ